MDRNRHCNQADGGIDGRIYFAVPDARELQSMAVEVKGGANVTIESLRALKGVLDNDNALMAGLIIRTPLGAVKERNFNCFMAEAGTIDLWGHEYPRMQLLTVEEILDGKRFDTPSQTIGTRGYFHVNSNTRISQPRGD